MAETLRTLIEAVEDYLTARDALVNDAQPRAFFDVRGWTARAIRVETSLNVLIGVTAAARAHVDQAERNHHEHP